MEMDMNDHVVGTDLNQKLAEKIVERKEKEKIPDISDQITPVTQETEDSKDSKNGEKSEKKPAKSTVDSAMADLQRMMRRTKCEYKFDEDTNRIMIKVLDKDSDKLIREIPPEKSIEILKRVWEVAGLIVDEKR